MGKSKKVKAPTLPTVGEDIKSAIQAYSDTSGQRANLALQDALTQLRISRETAPEALALQREYLPQYNQMLLDLERELAPQWYDLQQTEREREAKSVSELAPLIRGSTDTPEMAAMRAELGRQIAGELQSGMAMDPEMQREIEQGVRAAQSARGVVRGTAPVATEALIKGSAAANLRKARQQAAQQFITFQNQTQVDPWAAVTGRQMNPNYAQGQAPQPQFARLNQMLPGLLDATSQRNAQQYQLNYNAAQANASRKSGLGGAIGGLLGAGIGAFVPGGAGILPGMQIGSSLGGLFG